MPEYEDLRFLGYQLDAGIAKRVGGLWVVDAGIAHNEIRAAYRGGYPYTYTEAYVGVTRQSLSAYLFVSPNYYRSGYWTVYGQVEGAVSPAPKWHVTGHIGSLNYVAWPEGRTVRRTTLYDWRIGIGREFGNVEVHAALSGGGPGREFYYGSEHSRTALTGGASINF